MALNEQTIDPKGDILLQLSSPTGEVELVRVSTKVLCLASPVFDAMLGPNSDFQQTQGLRDSAAKVPTLHLQEDNTKALVMVLHAAHYAVHFLPRSIEMEEFYQLALVCHKYDMAKVLVPWAIIWRYNDRVEADDVDLSLLVIAWVFREVLKFSEITRVLILDASLDPSNRLVVDQGPIGCELIPEAVIHAIRGARLRLLSAIYDDSLGCLVKYTTAASSGLTVCDVPKGLNDPLPAHICQTRHACDSIAAGSIFITLGKLRLLPTQLEGDRRSFYEIYDAVVREPEMTIDVLAVNADGSHLHCSGRKRFEDVMDAQITNLQGLVLSDFMAKDLIF